MGKLIVLEGIDGSGKSTQFDALVDRLSNEGLDFVRVRFPRYDQPSSALVRMYLSGEFGADPEAVNAYAASSFFAVDRFASFAQEWRDYYMSGGLVLTDRYTTSNAIHQGAKLSAEAREFFFRWLYEYEFALMGLPEPDMVIYMDIDAKIASSRLKIRQSETSTTGDIHENDEVYLKQCAQSGIHAAEFYGWRKVSGVRGSLERTVEDISAEIYDLVSRTIKL